VEFGAFIQMVARQDLLRLKLEPDQAGRLENLASKLEAGAMEEGFDYPATRREAWRRRAQAVTRGEAQLMVLLEEFCRAGARDAGSLARIVSRVLGSPLPLEKLTERISSLLPPRPPARELEAASSSASSELPGEPGVLTFLSFASRIYAQSEELELPLTEEARDNALEQLRAANERVAQLTKLFLECDTDQSGSLDGGELAQMLKRLSAEHKTCRPLHALQEEVAAAMAASDPQGQGRLGLGAAIAMYCSRYRDFKLPELPDPARHETLLRLVQSTATMLELAARERAATPECPQGLFASHVTRGRVRHDRSEAALAAGATTAEAGKATGDPTNSNPLAIGGSTPKVAVFGGSTPRDFRLRSLVSDAREGIPYEAEQALLREGAKGETDDTTAGGAASPEHSATVIQGFISGIVQGHATRVALHENEQSASKLQAGLRGNMGRKNHRRNKSCPDVTAYLCQQQKLESFSASETEDSCSECDFDFESDEDLESPSPVRGFFTSFGRRSSQSSPFLDRMERIKLTEAEQAPVTRLSETQRARRKEKKRRKLIEQKRGVLKLKLTASALAVLQGATGWGSNPPSPATQSPRTSSPSPERRSDPGQWPPRETSM